MIDIKFIVVRSKMSKFYAHILEKYPLPTKTLTSGSLFSIGDALTQLSMITIMISFRKE